MEREFELNTKHPACLIWAAELPMAFAELVVLQVLMIAVRAHQGAASAKWGLRHYPASVKMGKRRARIAAAGVRRAFSAAAGVTQVCNATLAAISFK